MFRVEKSGLMNEEEGDDIICLYSDDIFLCDLALGREAAESFADSLNSNSVELVHVNDIIEDFFYS
ncbi:MAG: hypothetical protein ACI4IX_00620 [Acutalibacteraceae bacterium]